jgi:hypothetical protein
MLVMGPYEVMWIGVALAFLFLGPPLAGIVLAQVRARRIKDEARTRAGEKKETPTA